MNKTAKRVLSILMATFLLIGIISVTAAAAPALDATNATTAGLILPKLVSATGPANVYAFTAPKTGNYSLISTSYGIYANYDKLSDIFGSFPGSTALFMILCAVIDLPNYLTNFIFSLFMDGVFPSTNPNMILYDKDGNVLDRADNEGFPLFKSNRLDFQKKVQLEGGKTYYIAVDTTATTLKLPYLFGILPVL